MKCQTLKSFICQLMEEEMSSRRFAEGSRQGVRIMIRDFLRWTSRKGTPGILDLGKKDLVSFHTWLSSQKSKTTGKPLSASTINTRFYIIKWLYSCLYRNGLIHENPAHGLKLSLRVPSGNSRRPMSREEITQFLENLQTDSQVGLKDRTLFELIYSSGLRVSEAARLKIGDVDFDRRLMVVRGKFDRDRMVPISQIAWEFLKKFLGPRIGKKEDWIFKGTRGATKSSHLRGNSISERFRILLKRFKMDKKEISTHSIRHSTATHLLENGASVRHVQELLGHSSIESTVRYTHVMTDSLAKIYRRHHPREHDLFEILDPDYEKRLAKLKTSG